MIASNTKALTTLMLAKLVDENRFAWDTHVTDVYPDFKLGDAATTKQVEIKHLICACTGLPRQDLEWLVEFGTSTPSSVMQLLGTMQPTSKFGEVFQYSNVLAAAAGFVGGHAVFPDEEIGAAYDDAMKTRVFGPLGMSSTTFDMDAALKANHAVGYGDDPDGKVAPAKTEIDRGILPARPAGGAWSSVNDLAKYIRMELARGKLPDGTSYVSEANLTARRTPQVPIGEDQTYGMGLMTNTRWSIPLIHHGGDLVGYHSDMFFLPDQGVGGVILTAADDAMTACSSAGRSFAVSSRCSSMARTRPRAISGARSNVTSRTSRPSAHTGRFRPIPRSCRSSRRATRTRRSAR
jgi:CubicO group peptidase (beta-lactamase class C family)